MINVFINLGISLFTFLVFTLAELSVNEKLADIFFTVSGIFFSVGMSQVISFDFSQIVDRNIYIKNTRGLNKVRVSFTFQFALAGIAFIALKLFNSKSFIIPISFLNTKPFYVNIFFTFIVIYSLIFFIYNFHILANKKAAIGKKVNEEKMEDIENVFMNKFSSSTTS
jgi:hypothetical protein